MHNCDKDIENIYRDRIKQILWENTRINLIVTLRRDNTEIREIKFVVSPSEYREIMELRDAHRGTLIKNNQDIVINFLPTDILLIISNDYPEVKENFDKKYKEYDEVKKVLSEERH